MEPNVLLSDSRVERIVLKAPMPMNEEDVRDALKNWSPWKPEYFQELADHIQDTITRARIEASRRPLAWCDEIFIRGNLKIRISNTKIIAQDIDFAERCQEYIDISFSGDS
ncbi:hypothetical protein BGZ95_002945 [Linnemannia exigua]|uniref:Uncharacterized protein n=1 Tax=Linnemannia exigua TaxID=604196 RepID=A0AAD4D5F5_9FUNG|nr:hypothetical protein BGZ95_002945 [Linnemannia exigua]